jgi:hypothetical protein
MKEKIKLIYELERLANHPQFPENEDIYWQWLEIRRILWTDAPKSGSRIAVIYKESILFVGYRSEIEDKCRISRTHLNKLIKTGKCDRYSRYFVLHDKWILQQEEKHES